MPADPLADENALRQLADLTIDRMLQRMEGTDSSLLADPDVRDQFVRQVVHVLSEAVGTPPDAGARASAHTDGDLATRMGALRARQHIHPSESLRAAAELFDAALTVAAEQHGNALDMLTFARNLSLAIMTTLVPAAVAYVDVLLERLAVAHSEERRRLSRELHDRVAHSIAVSAHRVRQLLPSQPSAELHDALRLLEDALDETTAIARDLRYSVDDDLDSALHDYAADLAGTAPRIEVDTVGEPVRLATRVQEEAFLVVREAIRNACRHAAATKIQIRVDWSGDDVIIHVIDDGRGFVREEVRHGALGLAAAQERAELIEATLRIETQIGAGTILTLSIPRRGGPP